MTQKAGLIIEGTCIDSRVQTDAKSGLAITVTRFEVHEVLKGKAGAQYEMRQFGAPDPSQGAVVPGLPQYRSGERVILFLAPESRIGLTSPIGLMQGKFRVDRARADESPRVVNGLQNRGLYQGIRTEKFLRRDARGRVLKQDEPVQKLLRQKAGGSDAEGFKALVRKMATASPPVRSGSPSPSEEVSR